MMTYYSLMLFLNKLNKIPTQDTAFNVYLIYNKDNFRLKTDVYSTFLHKNTKHIINYSLLQLINNNIINITQNYFKIFLLNKKINLYINDTQNIYSINCIQLNPIIKKIQINNYRNLKIKKISLLEVFNKQIGLPINYLYIQNSIKKINLWYSSQGFKWVKIQYKYKKNLNLVNIKIKEGKLRRVIFINHTNNQNKYDFLKLNNSIKKDLSSLNNQILNIQTLEFHISKIKNKYSLDRLKYNVEYKSDQLVLVIKYKKNNKNRQLFNNKFSLKKLKKSFQILQLYLIAKYNNYEIRIINLINNNLYQTIYSNIIKLEKKNIIYKFIFNNLIHLHNKKIYFFTDNSVFLNFIVCLKPMFFTNKIIINNFSKNISLQKIFSSIYPYTYLIASRKIQINLKFLCFKQSRIIQNIINQFNSYYEKNLLVYYFYSFKNHINCQQIQKIQKFYLLTYKIKLSLILNKYITIIKNICLSYNQLRYYPFNSLYLSRLTKQYIHLLQIQYYLLNNLPKIFSLENTIIIFTQINILIGYLSKYLFLTNNFLTKQNVYSLKPSIYTILYIEYNLYLFNYNYLYVSIKYMPGIKDCINYKPTKNVYNYTEYVAIQYGLGIQFSIPIKYIPNMRLELQIKNSIKFLVYIYKNSLFY